MAGQRSRILTEWDTTSMLYINSIEDIEKVLREGQLAEVRAVLRHRELAPIFLTEEGLRALAILRQRDPHTFRASASSHRPSAAQAAAASKPARRRPHKAAGK